MRGWERVFERETPCPMAFALRIERGKALSLSLPILEGHSDPSLEREPPRASLVGSKCRRKIWIFWIFALENPGVRNISLTDAVKKWGEVIDLAKGGEPITLTSHGRPVARLLGMPRKGEASDIAAALEQSARGRAALEAVRKVHADLVKQGWQIDGPFLTRAAVSINDGLFRG